METTLGVDIKAFWVWRDNWIQYPLALTIRFLSNIGVLDCIGLTVDQNASIAFLAFVGRDGAAIVERTIVVMESVVDSEGDLNS